MARTSSNSAARPEFTIVDLRSGRGLGGHCFDYLISLRAAFADRRIAVIAPFVETDPPAGTRLNVYLRGLSAYRRAIAGNGVGIVHNSSMNDYICLAAAALTIRPARRGSCMMMLYRDPTVESFGAGGPALNRVMIWLIVRLIRHGVLRPASDSPAVLEHWLEKSETREGSVVPTPPLPSDTAGEPTTLELPEPAGPLVVIPGRMRHEKGAANYPAVARAVLDRFPDGAIAIQTAEGNAESARVVQRLEDEFAGDRRVILLSRHLSGGDYTRLLRAADIAALPYDVAAYGPGSSGVVGDALSCGAVVACSRIEWIEREYGTEPRVVFIEDPASSESIGEALLRARSVEAAAPRDDNTVEFGRRWNAAVDEAIRQAA